MVLRVASASAFLAKAQSSSSLCAPPVARRFCNQFRIPVRSVYEPPRPRRPQPEFKTVADPTQDDPIRKRTIYFSGVECPPGGDGELLLYRGPRSIQHFVTGVGFSLAAIMLYSLAVATLFFTEWDQDMSLYRWFMGGFAEPLLEDRDSIPTVDPLYEQAADEQWLAQREKNRKKLWFTKFTGSQLIAGIVYAGAGLFCQMTAQRAAVGSIKKLSAVFIDYKVQRFKVGYFGLAGFGLEDSYAYRDFRGASSFFSLRKPEFMKVAHSERPLYFNVRGTKTPRYLIMPNEFQSSLSSGKVVWQPEKTWLLFNKHNVGPTPLAMFTGARSKYSRE